MSTGAILASCTTTPSAGPGFDVIEKNAAVRMTSAKRPAASGIDYALLDLNKTLLNYLEDKESSSILTGFGGGRGGAPSLPLGVGDIVQVAVFESQAGGLFIPSEAGSRPGNFVTLPQQAIDRDGTISVPYAGRIRAAGRSVREVQTEIEDTLANRAIEPQVQITRVNSRSAQVAVLGDVNEPAKIELTEAGERILDAISQTGGLSAPGEETFITLQRSGRSATVLYNDLINAPAENIYLSPGDTVLIDRRRRTFTAFGASGLNGRFDFEESDLTLAEALGKAGGLLDGRANPSHVMLYRQLSKDSLGRMGVDTSRFTGVVVPVIIKANLRDPAGFFAMQQLSMHDKDMLYIGNADSVEIIKFLDIVNSITSTASGVSSDVTSTRDSVRDL